jgi:hypothetical protein
MKKEDFKTRVIEPETIIRKYGYEYHLVAIDRKGLMNIGNPAVFGMKGFALKSVNKIKLT